MGGYKKIKGTDGNTFSSTNQPANRGRHPSIKTQLKELLYADGNITIQNTQVIRVNEDGSVVLKLPTQMQLAMKLSSWAMSKKGSDSLKAIQMIMETIDGKATQPVEVSSESPRLIITDIRTIIDARE